MWFYKFFQIFFFFIMSFCSVDSLFAMKRLFTCSFEWKGHEQGYKFQDFCYVHPKVGQKIKKIFHPTIIVLGDPCDSKINVYQVDFFQKKNFQSFIFEHTLQDVKWGFIRENVTYDLIALFKDKDGKSGIRFLNTLLERSISFLYPESTYFTWSHLYQNYFITGNNKKFDLIAIENKNAVSKKTLILDKIESPITASSWTKKKELLTFSDKNKTLTAWDLLENKKSRIDRLDLRREYPSDYFLKFNTFKGNEFAIATNKKITTYAWNRDENIIEKKYEKNISGIVDFKWSKIKTSGDLIAILLKNNRFCFFVSSDDKLFSIDLDFSGKKILSFEFLHYHPSTFIVMTQDVFFPSHYEVNAYKVISGHLQPTS